MLVVGRTYRKYSWWGLGDFWCLFWQQTLDVCSDCLEPGIIHNRKETLDPLHCLLWKWSSLATRMNAIEICLSWKSNSSSFLQLGWDFSPHLGHNRPFWEFRKQKAWFGDVIANTNSYKGQHVSGETCWWKFRHWRNTYGNDSGACECWDAWAGRCVFCESLYSVTSKIPAQLKCRHVSPFADLGLDANVSVQSFPYTCPESNLMWC